MNQNMDILPIRSKGDNLDASIGWISPERSNQFFGWICPRCNASLSPTISQCMVYLPPLPPPPPPYYIPCCPDGSKGITSPYIPIDWGNNWSSHGTTKFPGTVQIY